MQSASLKDAWKLCSMHKGLHSGLFVMDNELEFEKGGFKGYLPGGVRSVRFEPERLGTDRSRSSSARTTSADTRNMF